MDKEKTIATWWYNTCDGKCIGIVKYETEYGETIFRIGLGKGINQKQDEWFIKEFGDKFIPESIN
jgi:hypothetical protein